MGRGRPVPQSVGEEQRDPFTPPANCGTKAELNAPSAKSARNRLGKRWATAKASATGPVPII